MKKLKSLQKLPEWFDIREATDPQQAYIVNLTALVSTDPKAWFCFAIDNVLVSLPFMREHDLPEKDCKTLMGSKLNQTFNSEIWAMRVELNKPAEPIKEPVKEPVEEEKPSLVEKVKEAMKPKAKAKKPKKKG
jgi:hypothetical protein